MPNLWISSTSAAGPSVSQKERSLLRPSRMWLMTIRRSAIRPCAPSILVDPSELADEVTDLPRHLGRDEGPEGRHERLRPAVQHGVDELVVGPLEGLEARRDRRARALASVAGGAHLAENLA